MAVPGLALGAGASQAAAGGRAHAVGAAPAAMAARDPASASALAAASGRRVEVMADRTDWSQTFAEPRGGFLSQISVAPVRVREPGGSWARVDTTLSARPGGLVAPGATVTGLVLSGGGAGPLMRVWQAAGDPAGSVSMWWPYGRLPRPSLSGATATYASVLPGVNLLVTAEPTGVDAVLEVMSRAAAADPRLARIRFPVSAPGLRVAADGHGGVAMTGAAGRALFAEPPARMWDSSETAAAGRAAAGVAAAGRAAGVPAGLAGPAPGDHMGIAGVAVRAGSVTLSPVASVLAGSSTRFPVFIDPAINYSHNQADWLDVGHDFTGYTTGGSSGGGGPCKSQGGSWNCWGDWDFTSSVGGIRAGVWCNGAQFVSYNPNLPPSQICNDSSPDSSWGVYRSYLNFTLPAGLSGADYVDAKLSVYNVHSFTCNEGRKLQLWQTSTATSDMAWNSKPGELTWLDSATSSYTDDLSACNPGGITLNASNAVKAAAASGKVTLELRAIQSSEDASPPDLTNWRRFLAEGTVCADPGASTPCLQVFWMHLPDQATAPATEGTFDASTGLTRTHCATGAAMDYVNTTSPWLDAKVTDPDSGVALKGWISDAYGFPGGGGGQAFPGGAVDSSNGAFTAQLPNGADGQEHNWQAYGEATAQDTLSLQQVVEDGNTTGFCNFTIDTTAPTGVVAVSPPSGGWTVGKAGTMTFSDPNYSGGDSDVVGYFYSVGSSDPALYVQASNGTAKATFKPYTEATEPVYVRAVDHAGNVGPPKKNSSGTVVANYTFTASGGSNNIAVLGYWPLNGTGSDLSGQRNDVSGFGAFQWASAVNPPGYHDTFYGFAGTGSGVVSAEAGFTASVWASASGCPANATCVAMSEAAVNNSVFTLAYQSSCSLGSYGCWAFTLWPTDQASPPPIPVTVLAKATQAEQNGAWTQLAGVFDPGGPAMTLYVNGGQAAQVHGSGVPTAWRATTLGSLWLGGASQGSSQLWYGNLSDACVLFGALSGANITTLYSGVVGGANPNPDGCSVLLQQNP